MAELDEKMTSPDTASYEKSMEEQTVKAENEAGTGPRPSNEDYPGGLTLSLILAGLFLTLLCTGLDRSIIATAVPKITTEFDSLNDVAWYGSSYLVGTCCFQLLFGKLYVALPIKWVFLAGLAVFEIGSIVCAVAGSSAVLIVGRTIAGVGAAGLMSGALIILARSVPLKDRPKYTGALGGSIGIAQIIAPLLGGVFTDKVTWRWCFWINLPLGGVTFAVVLFLVHIPADSTTQSKRSLKGFMETFDLLGTLLLIPWVICLLFALQWGGTEYAWGSWRVIVLLVVFAVVFLVWCFVEVREGDKATVPPRIIKNRSMAAGTLFMFCNMANFFILTYYIPIWFQAVKGDSAYQSGINFLGACGAMSIAVVAAGFMTSKIGYYVPTMIIGTALNIAGCGMAYAFDLGSSTGFWVVSLILIGLGVGFSVQQPLVAAQTVFQPADMALATSMLIFVQSLSGAIALAAAQNVFHTEVVTRVDRIEPSVDAQLVVGVGAYDLQEELEERYPGQVQEILGAYNGALQEVLLISLVFACLMIIGVAAMEWVSVKKEEKKPVQGLGGEENGEKGDRVSA